MTLESKGLGLDVKKTEIMISSENARLVKVEGMFPCTVWRKVVGSNSILKVVITKTLDGVLEILQTFKM